MILSMIRFTVVYVLGEHKLGWNLDLCSFFALYILPYKTLTMHNSRFTISSCLHDTGKLEPGGRIQHTI